jgi:hypothetical protein
VNELADVDRLPPQPWLWKITGTGAAADAESGWNSE